jgi:hypothetical protein
MSSLSSRFYDSIGMKVEFAISLESFWLTNWARTAGLKLIGLKLIGLKLIGREQF